MAKVNTSVEDAIMFLKDHARKYDSMVYSVKNFKKVNDYFVIYESDFIF